jgi:hypothetical protein
MPDQMIGWTITGIDIFLELIDIAGSNILMLYQIHDPVTYRGV